MRSDRERLLDILEAIEQIEKYVGARGGRQSNKMNCSRRGSFTTYRSSERPPAS